MAVKKQDSINLIDIFQSSKNSKTLTDKRLLTCWRIRSAM